MTMQPADRACPVDLNYPDPEPPRLDVPAIVRRGQRVRRRRRLTAAGGAVAACAVAAGLTVLAVRPAGPAPSGPVAPGTHEAPVPRALLANPAVQAELAASPPVTTPALLSRQPGYTTIAWEIRDGQVCWAAVADAGSNGATSHSCGGWTRDEVTRAGRAGGSGGLSALLPGLAPPPPHGDAGLVAWYGLATPAASRVVVTFFGHDFTARPVPLRLASGRTVGVYLIFMRVPASANGYSDGDITRAVAYNQADQVVATHGRWA